MRPCARGDVVGWQVVAKPLALVGGAPQLAASGRNRHTHAIADAGSENAPVRALGVEGEHVAVKSFAAARPPDSSSN
jgi:hypothetical protein